MAAPFLNHVTLLLGQIDWGGLPRGAVSDSISRYAEEIAPAVRAATS
jgi:hypothetical protein